MVERIKTYLIKNKYLYGQIEADVRDYILDNAISIGKYLNTQEEMVCDGDGKGEQNGDKVHKILPPHQINIPNNNQEDN